MVVFDAGCDWLTLVVCAGHEQFNEMQTIIQNVGVEMAGGVSGLVPASWQGYTGWKTYGLFYGIREDGFVIKATGHEAKAVEKLCRERQWRPKCTRADIQITARVGQTEDDYPCRVREAIEKSTAGNGAAKQSKLAVYKDSGRDTGFTLGSRSGGRYSRFYDKSAEQRQRVVSGLWRFECEFKSRRALQIFAMLMSATAGYWLALSLVSSEFSRAGADMSWVQGAEKLELPSTHRRNDDERRIAWLRTHVSRTVQKLVSAGRGEEVFEALGVDIASLSVKLPTTSALDADEIVFGEW